MLTVLEAIKLSSDYLEKKGIESPRLNAELLLAEILSCKRLELYLSFERPLKDDEVNRYRDWIARRGKFEPMQYIIGHVEFYGSNFIVNPSVLIPRPETELLVERIILSNKNKRQLNILDIGVGSGNIAISLAKNLEHAKIVACDISEEAVKIAKRNADVIGVSKKISFIVKDILTHEFENGSFDIIVSNPPYVPDAELGSLQREIIDHEPRIAVTDSSNGYKFYDHIITHAWNWLKQNGLLYFELGKDQSEKVKMHLEETGFSNIKLIKDYQDIDRIIYGEKI